MTHLHHLIDHWLDEANHIRTRYNDEPLARLAEVHAGELETAIREAENQSLTLGQAAELSGYSVDHLGRTLRQGKIPNAGRKGSPRIRVRDLPRKPGLPQEAPRPQLVGSSKSQVARAVLSQMGGEG